MKNILKIVLLLSLAGTPFAFAANSKKELKKHMMNYMPFALCQEKSEYLSCYKLSQKKCYKSVKSSLKSCMIQITPPRNRSISSLAKRAKWGRKIGRCLGKQFHMNNIKLWQSKKSCTLRNN